jgi:hypothetical protein
MGHASSARRARQLPQEDCASAASLAASTQGSTVIYIPFTFPFYASFFTVNSSSGIARVSHDTKTTVPGFTSEAALDFDAIPSGGSSLTSGSDPQ